MKHNFVPGTLVTYGTEYKLEKGIVKSLSNFDDKVFVVYKCGGDWDNYRDYTAALTDVKDLRMGWPERRGLL